jgi:uncharacterized RDD family membrane protein YckC
MNAIEFESAHHVKIEYELASTLQRILAFTLDTGIFLVYYFFMAFLLSSSSPFATFGSELFVTLLLIKLPWIFYHPICEYFANGQSIGKLATGIRVVSVNGERLGLREIFTRWIFRGDFLWITADATILLWLAIGVFGVIFSGTSMRRQRLGDSMAGTVVIRNKSNVQYTLREVLNIKNSSNHQTLYPNATRLTDEDVLLIKNTIQRVQLYPNDETKRFAIELADETARLLGLSETPPKRLEFLQNVLQDYVVLTR